MSVCCCPSPGSLNTPAVGDATMIVLNFVLALWCAVLSRDQFLDNRPERGWTGLFLSAANFAAGLALLLRPI